MSNYIRIHSPGATESSVEALANSGCSSSSSSSPSLKQKNQNNVLFVVLVSHNKPDEKKFKTNLPNRHRIATHSKGAFLHSNITADQVSCYASLGQVMNCITQKDAFSQNCCAVDSQI